MITPSYLKPDITVALRDVYYGNDPQGLQLESFLSPQEYARLLRAVDTVNFKQKELRDQHSYFGANVPMDFFSSKEFLSFASAVTGRALTKATAEVRIFMHRSFTLMHDDAATDKIEFYLDLTPRWNGKAGGSITLLSSSGQALAIPARPNTLILGQSGRSYVKYVNNAAGKEGRLLIYGLLS